MKITLENLGNLDFAEFELGELTIICGKNNTGKTYATYALFGFLHNCKTLLREEINDQLDKNKEKINNLEKNGRESFNLDQWLLTIPDLIQDVNKIYTSQLPTVFSSDERFFKDASFSCDLESSVDFKKRLLDVALEKNHILNDKNNILISKKKDQLSFEVVSLKSESKENHFLKTLIAEFLVELTFYSIFPRTFIASAERTGAAIFSKELYFSRNKLLKELSKEKEIDPIQLLLNQTQDYALPVEKNVEFTRNLEKISKNTSVISKKHPEILQSFSEMIGGSYEVKKNIGVKFKPKGKPVRLSMDESSSAVRSMLDIGFYLHHIAEPGDLLMVDEPELNLHPENQRLVARLFASLINVGIKVFLTTHSDYLIKEINTLIMLNKEDEVHQKIMQDEEGYEFAHLLNADQVKVYIAKRARIKVQGKKNKVLRQTFVSAKIDSERGIEVDSFDETINKMNEIEDRILWRDE